MFAVNDILCTLVSGETAMTKQCTKNYTIMNNYSILENGYLRTFTKAIDLKSFAHLIWQYELRSENITAKDYLNSWLNDDDREDKLTVDDLSTQIADNLVYSKLMLIKNRVSLSSLDKKAVCDYLETRIELSISKVLNIN
jgi:hypothetical protein